MARRLHLEEYLTNIRALLRLDAAKFSIMVDRQVQCRVLPAIAGNRASLEAPLWELLILCLDGPEAPIPTCDAAAWERAQAAAAGRQALSGDAAAAFPGAAAKVLAALATLREHGVYPPPKLGPA